LAQPVLSEETVFLDCVDYPDHLVRLARLAKMVTKETWDRQVKKDSRVSSVSVGCPVLKDPKD
jgi:hypothetical protein